MTTRNDKQSWFVPLRAFYPHITRGIDCYTIPGICTELIVFELQEINDAAIMNALTSKAGLPFNAKIAALLLESSR